MSIFLPTRTRTQKPVRHLRLHCLGRGCCAIWVVRDWVSIQISASHFFDPLTSDFGVRIGLGCGFFAPKFLVGGSGRFTMLGKLMLMLHDGIRVAANNKEDCFGRE